MLRKNSVSPTSTGVRRRQSNFKYKSIKSNVRNGQRAVGKIMETFDAQ